MVFFEHVLEGSTKCMNDPNKDNGLDSFAPEITTPHHTAGFLKEHGTVFYIILKVLLRMKNRLGMEAMLEYMASYAQSIEEHNSHLRSAVEEAVELISVEKLYREATKNK